MCNFSSSLRSLPSSTLQNMEHTECLNDAQVNILQYGSKCEWIIMVDCWTGCANEWHTASFLTLLFSCKFVSLTYFEALAIIVLERTKSIRLLHENLLTYQSLTLSLVSPSSSSSLLFFRRRFASISSDNSFNSFTHSHTPKKNNKWLSVGGRCM